MSITKESAFESNIESHLLGNGWRSLAPAAYARKLGVFGEEIIRQLPAATLLANVTNDAWFGDTAEPWIHDALSKFRAIEHRRDLVRSTIVANTSAFSSSSARYCSQKWAHRDGS